MIQTFAGLPNQASNIILCRYINSGSHIQIVKITNIRDYYLERTVFPGQQLLFEAPLEAQLEIFSGEIVQAIVKDKISCCSLQVQCNEMPASMISL